MNEQWRSLPKSDGSYKVSNQGRVWSCLRDVLLKVSYAGNRRQYQQVTVMRDGKRMHRYVHQLVLETFKGPCPKHMEASHLDGNPVNNWNTNLIWDTHKNNLIRASENQNIARGNRIGLAKLTDRDIPHIRKLSELGVSTQILAKGFGVAFPTMQSVILRKTWKHIK